MYGIGIMSGTSLDGIDTVLVEIHGYGQNTKLNVIAYNEFPLQEELVEKIKKACSLEHSHSDLICSLNFELGYTFVEAVKALLQKANFPLDKVDYIASHGQTIFHIPEEKDGLQRSTLQIGEAAILAYELQTTVISNFRVMDMAAGGQGAPLVPYSEYILYSQPHKNIVLQNIGGIGNLTFLNGSLNIDDIFAFDTGPGNMMINEACHILYGLPYDDLGKIAKKGRVIDELLEELMNHPYMQKQPPKSTGREDFGEFFVKDILKRYNQHKKEDIITTFTMFTAKSISFHYQRDILTKYSIDEVLIGGGGSHNNTLIQFIKDELSPIPVYTQDEKGYSSDAKEAIAFAILGNETLNRHYSNVKSSTGASQYVILGQITPKPL
ncbi:MAG: anhydro-N-acetylmuramic acid kinase AnmK [Longibaculum sp.]